MAFGLVMAAVQHYDGRGSVAVEEKRTKAVQQAAASDDVSPRAKRLRRVRIRPNAE